MQVDLGPNLTMASLLDQYPGARRALFSAFHIGGCQSCAYDDADTLAQVCEKNEIELEKALAILAESQAHDQEMLISPKEFDDFRLSGSPPLILDTRTREEFEAVPLTGAQLMTQDLQTQIFSDSDTEKTVLLFDHRGREVLDHCAWFRGHGLKKTFGLDGGLDRFAQEIDSSIQRYRLEL